MANEIDNRVVQMQFDNAQFERGVSTSLGTLDKLKSALKLNGAADGFNNIQNASNRLDFSGLIAGVNQAGQKFSMLEIVAITAIQNITNRAVNAGIRLAKSLSVDQVAAGWAKFAEKAQSVGTIMSATGKSVEDVGDQLDMLNRYTDETSASFTDMTRNIGKFTNAGVPLEDAVQEMQGITNWAYKSGASVNEAGRAMYNLSQAMAVGSVKLIDWRSIENANMATVDFKKNVIQTAVAMGTLKESSKEGEYYVKGFSNAIVTATNFNSELSRGWFSADVLKATLEKYGDFSTDIINLADSTDKTVTYFMDSVKEYEKGTLDFDKLAEETGKSAEYLRKQFALMGTASESVAKRLSDQQNATRRTKLEGKELEEQTSKIQVALEKAYVDSQNGITDFSEVLSLTGISSKELQEIFEELAENQTLGIGAFRAAQEYRSLRDTIDATTDAVSTSWMKIFELLFGNYEEAKQIWGSVGNMLYELFAEPLEGVKELLETWHFGGGYQQIVHGVEYLTDAMIGLKEATDNAFRFFGITDEIKLGWMDSASSKFEEFSRILRTIFTGETVRSADVLGEALNKLDGAPTDAPKKLAESLELIDNADVSNKDYFFTDYKYLETAERFANVIDAIGNAIFSITEVARGLWTAVQPVVDFVKSVGRDALDLIQDISAAILGIDLENDADFWKFFEEVGNKIAPVFQWLADIIHSFTETLGNIINPDKEGGLSDFGETIGKIFGGIGTVFNKFFPILSSIGDAIGTVITTIVDKLTEFTDSATVQDFIDLLKEGFNVGILAGITGFVGGLSKQSKGLGDVLTGIGNFFTGKGDASTLKEAVSGGGQKGGFLAGLGESIDSFATSLSNSINKVVDVNAIKTFATAVLMLAGALFLLSLTDAESAAASLAILTVGVGELLSAMKLFTDDTVNPLTLIAAGIGFAAMSVGVIALAGALILLSLVPSDTLAMTIMNLTFAIGVMVGALSALSLIEPGRLIASAAAMLIMAPALLALAISIGIMALIPAEKAATGIMIMLFALGEMVGVLAALSLIGPMAIAAAAALLILSPALIVMALALAILAAIPAQEAANAVMMLLFVLGEVAGVLAAVSLLGPMCLVAAAALLILSPALLLMAVALFAISKIPMQALGAAIIGLALTFAVIAAAAWAVAPVVVPLLAFAGALLAISASVVILGAGLILVASGIMLLIGAASMLVDTVIGAFDELISTALNLLDQFFDLGVKILDKVIEGIKSLFADLGPVAKDILDGLIKGITDGLSSLWEAGKSLGSSLINGVKSFLGIESPSKAFMEVGDYSILGLLESVDDGLSDVANAGKTIGETLIDSTEEALSDYDSIMDGHELSPVVDMSNLTPNTDTVGIRSLANARSAFDSAFGTAELGNQNVRNYSPVFNIYQQPNQSPEDLAAIINRELGRLYVT